MKDLQQKLLSYREENERLTAENIYLLMETETLTLKVAELEGKGKSKKNPIIAPNTSGKKKRPGRKPGFKGTSRKKPDHIDKCIDVTLSTCPQCGTPLKDPVEVTERTVEDVDPPKPRITEYRIYRYYCPHCGEIISATSQDAIPKCRLGINVTLLAVYLKYGLHLSFGKICENLKICFGIKTTKATIYNHIRLLSHYYTEEFEEIKRQIRESEAVHVDETGWRINGTNHWLWAFVTKNAVLFTIDKRRSSDVPKEVLGEDFDGVLISDFYSAYDKLPYKKQKCLVHLLRETHKISEKNPETKRFHKWTKRFFRDAAKFKENPHSQKEILKAKNDSRQDSIERLQSPTPIQTASGWQRDSKNIEMTFSPSWR
jgi:transposase-like protein